MKERHDVPHAQPMVGWYDPRTLLRSAWLVAVSNVFGRYSDTRLIEALASQSQSSFDYSKESGDFWLDVVCDTGDGWDSTYAVASTLAEPALEVADAQGLNHHTRRGRVLVFGGDEVYPYPSRQAYVDRTEVPYSTALAGRGALPDVFAVPGNHDWYDGLIAFSRMFCRPQRGFAGCRTQQTRSYFALALPGNWWLLALDLQLGAELDEPQARYFQKVAKQLGPDAQLILCVPEPVWIFEKAYPEHRYYADDPAVAFLERIFGRKVQVFLTGDLHFYKRHANEEGIQKITSGGGGAFLHPTHAPSTRVLGDGFTERATFPDESVSRRLAWRNLLLPFLSPYFMLLPGFVYALSAWLASSSLEASDLVTMDSALEATVTAAIRHPLNGSWILCVLAAFVFFTDTHMRWWRVLGGLSHGLLQLGTAFAVGWLGYLVTVRGLNLTYGAPGQLIAGGVFTFALGGAAGAFITGAYLLISVQVFGRHSNEAFSSLRVVDYKSWLRLRIDERGALSIYCIGIDRVPRRWKRATRRAAGQATPEPQRQAAATFVADDPAATAPRLVDFVKLEPPAAANPKPGQDGRD